jgi:hypothetical protein
MSEKTIADKMFLRNAKSMLILNGNVHPGMVSQMPPELVKTNEHRQRQGGRRADVRDEPQGTRTILPQAKERLGDKGSLWVAYLKQTASKATDINRDSINAYEGKRYHGRGDDLDRRRLVGLRMKRIEV